MQEAIVRSCGVSRDVSYKKTVHSAFSLPTTASPISQVALRGCFGEAVVEASPRGEHCTQDIHSKTFFFHGVDLGGGGRREIKSCVHLWCILDR